jgi:hypothetical protein
MSLGLGILLSTIVLIAAWQIDKRNAWRTVGKASLWIGGAALLICAATFGYFQWRTYQTHNSEIAQIRNPATLVYWGIHLSLTKAEVRYLKGDPTETEPADKDKKTAERWLYKLGDSPRDYFYDIYWDDAGERVVAMTCQGNDTSNCDRVLGLGVGSSEADVRSTLGKRDEDNPPNDKGLKSLAYGTGKGKLMLFLARGKIDVIALGGH